MLPLQISNRICTARPHSDLGAEQNSTNFARYAAVGQVRFEMHLQDVHLRLPGLCMWQKARAQRGGE